MFVLSKLTYIECDKLQKYWYNSIPNNVIKVNIKQPCKTLKVNQTGKKKNWHSVGYQDIFHCCRFFSLRLFRVSSQIMLCMNKGVCKAVCKKWWYGLSKICPWKWLWDRSICYSAAQHGNLECLKYAHKNNCPLDDYTSSLDAYCGSLDCLKYMIMNFCPWDEGKCKFTAHNGFIDLLKFSHENGCSWGEDTCKSAASSSAWCMLMATVVHGL